ncbi:MAG: anthranilate phosphoribosyltransferase [Kineosporiaceae bacterium]|nr:anthranilate phosphoribosyltransferase [Kineosporiaceae bacterium]
MGELTWGRLISALLSGEDLSRDHCAWAMDQVMSAEATPSQLAGFLVALRAKGETVEELAGLVDAMLRHAVRIDVPGRCVDVVGTGGDRRHTVNISTMAALVVAGTGRRVVKHGNRASSSSTGAADVLEALGVRLDLGPARVAELATEVGITFCFAQVFHPGMRHAAVTRRELGVGTAFNFLGPLTNPARPAAAAVGVADPRMAPIMAGVFATRGTSALLFRGDDGLDELSTTAPSVIWVVEEGQVRRTRVDAVDLGLARAELSDLVGGDPAHNAAVVRSVLAGDPGPIRDAVLLNAAAAVVAADGAGAGELPDRLRTALGEVAAAVDSGSAAGVLDRWVAASGT